jgi:dihydroneopterin aldolase
MTEPSKLDEVVLRGLRARGRHGVFDWERERGAPFVVDVVLRFDTRSAAADDDLAKTVDYGLLAECVVAVVEGESVALVETLAQRVAEAVLAHPLVEETEVTVHKPEAPVQVPVDDVTVRITRRRRTEA